MRDRRDTRTLDLLDWEMTSFIPRIDEEQVRAATLRGRLARMVALVLGDATESRETIATKMADFLGEDVSVNTLNQCASQAREDHTLSAIRCAALAHATGDLRIMQVLLQPLSHAAVPAKYLPAIEAEMASEQADELSLKADALREQAKYARRQWKGARR